MVRHQLGISPHLHRGRNRYAISVKIMDQAQPHRRGRHGNDRPADGPRYLRGVMRRAALAKLSNFHDWLLRPPNAHTCFKFLQVPKCGVSTAIAEVGRRDDHSINDAGFHQNVARPTRRQEFPVVARSADGGLANRPPPVRPRRREFSEDSGALNWEGWRNRPVRPPGGESAMMTTSRDRLGSVSRDLVSPNGTINGAAPWPNLRTTSFRYSRAA
jgi:hypothetical protein